MTDRSSELKNLYEEMQNPRETTSQQRYDRILRQAREIFVDRNKIYGDAFNQTGAFGTFAVLAGDVARLRRMIYDGNSDSEKVRREIEDKLLDVINQAVLTVIVLEDNNWTGEDLE